MRALLLLLAVGCSPAALPAAARCPEPAGWRFLVDAVQAQAGLAWCPASGACEVMPGVGLHARDVVATAGGRLWFLEVADGTCEVRSCDVDDGEPMCGTPAESTCNPNNGSLTLLAGDRVLYRGGLGSGISAATLFGEDGRTLWSSVHAADELSPSHAYLLVGAAADDDVLGEIRRMSVIDLRDGHEAAAWPVPGGEVRAVWNDDALEVRWRGGHRRVSLPGAGPAIEGQDAGWQPFSGD